MNDMHTADGLGTEPRLSDSEVLDKLARRFKGFIAVKERLEQEAAAAEDRREQHV